MNAQPDISGLFPDAAMESSTTNELTPMWVEGELRILDTDLAQRLGFAQPLNIRNTIKRHEDALRALGVLFTVKKTSGPAGGRPTDEYYLNRKQAIFITAKSGTAKAIEITIEIIRRFDAYERGVQAPPFNQSALTPEARSVFGGIMKRVCTAQNRPLFQMLEVLTQKVAALEAAPQPVTTVEGEVCRDYWSMRKILRTHGIEQKGRGRLVHQCTASMKAWCIKHRRLDAVKTVPDEEGRDRCVFETAATQDWLAELGWAIIVEHKSRLDEPEEQ